MSEHSDSLYSDPFRDYLGLREAADVLGIHPDSLRRLLAQAPIPGAIKWRNRQWLFEASALHQFASTYSGRPGRPARGLFGNLTDSKGP